MRLRSSTWVGAVLVAVLATMCTGGTAQAEEAPPPGCTSLENCYGYADMQAFYEEIIGSAVGLLLRQR